MLGPNYVVVLLVKLERDDPLRVNGIASMY